MNYDERCHTCNGLGYVVTNPTRNGDPQHDTEHDCPECAGGLDFENIELEKQVEKFERECEE